MHQGIGVEEIHPLVSVGGNGIIPGVGERALVGKKVVTRGWME